MSTIILRSGKNEPLTGEEIDRNFIRLNNDKAEKTNNLGDMEDLDKSAENLGVHKANSITFGVLKMEYGGTGTDFSQTGNNFGLIFQNTPHSLGSIELPEGSSFGKPYILKGKGRNAAPEFVDPKSIGIGVEYSALNPLKIGPEYSMSFDGWADIPAGVIVKDGNSLPMGGVSGGAPGMVLFIGEDGRPVWGHAGVHDPSKDIPPPPPPPPPPPMPPYVVIKYDIINGQAIINTDDNNGWTNSSPSVEPVPGSFGFNIQATNVGFVPPPGYDHITNSTNIKVSGISYPDGRSGQGTSMFSIFYDAVNYSQTLSTGSPFDLDRFTVQILSVVPWDLRIEYINLADTAPPIVEQPPASGQSSYAITVDFKPGTVEHVVSQQWGGAQAAAFGIIPGLSLGFVEFIPPADRSGNPVPNFSGTQFGSQMLQSGSFSGPRPDGKLVYEFIAPDGVLNEPSFLLTLTYN